MCGNNVWSRQRHYQSAWITYLLIISFFCLCFYSTSAAPGSRATSGHQHVGVCTSSPCARITTSRAGTLAQRQGSSWHERVHACGIAARRIKYDPCPGAAGVRGKVAEAPEEGLRRPAAKDLWVLGRV